MARLTGIAAAAVAVALAGAACSDDRLPSSGRSPAVVASPESVASPTSVVTGSSDHPVGVVRSVTRE